MNNFTPAETAACRQLVDLALAEDLDGAGDVTSQAMIPLPLQGQAVIVARAEGIVAGLPAAAMVAGAVDGQLIFNALVDDCTPVRHGTRLATLSGSMRSILAVERTALNLLQRLSGIATLTSRFVDAIKGLPTHILDTRKTTPGWRLLEKYAVRCGGGHNHRLGLYDGILIKDNHLAATAHAGIAAAVQAARDHWHGQLPVEIEVETLDQLRQVLPVRPDIVLLDNMTQDQMREAVRLRSELATGVQLEASGGVMLTTVRAIAATGVDRISVGALTHSAIALDMALDYVSP